MEQRKPPEYNIEVLADPTCIRDVVRGVLHTIFFHRYFPSLRPSSMEILDFTLPVVADPEFETLVETRVGQLVRQLHSTSSPRGSVRGTLTIQFYEKKRRKAGGGLGWFTGVKAGEEEVCWEKWNLHVALATPRTENDYTRVTKAISTSLHKTVVKVITIVNRDRDHIPPITTSETNPFPYGIDINPKAEVWGRGRPSFGSI